MSCCVASCNSIKNKCRKYVGLKIPFHQFPSDENLRKTWVNVIRARGRVHPVIMESMDFVDFYPVNDFAVIYVTEGDLVSGVYKRNLVKLKKAKIDRNAIVVEKTQMSGQYFETIQKLAVMELELGLIPVSGVEECCHVLVTIIRMGGEDKNSPFMMKRRAPPIDTYLLRTLTNLPSVGETKAQALILKFKSLINICNASLNALTKVVGARTAQEVNDFLHNC